MAKIRDRSEDFKDAVRAAALSLDYSESKLAAVLASFIMHKPPQKFPFTEAALKTVSVFVKTCKDQIDILKNRILEEEEKVGNSTGRLSLWDDSSRANVVAHKHVVVLILSERLHSVTAQFDRLRSIRFQDAVNRAMPRRKMHRVPDAKSSGASKSDLGEFGDQELPSSSGPVRVQDQLLDDETRALQVELTSLLDAVQETETKMVEMSALNHLMSTHVLQQAQQIEHLYDQALH